MRARAKHIPLPLPYLAPLAEDAQAEEEEDLDAALGAASFPIPCVWERKEKIFIYMYTFDVHVRLHPPSASCAERVRAWAKRIARRQVQGACGVYAASGRLCFERQHSYEENLNGKYILNILMG